MTYDDRPWLKFYDRGVSPEIEIPDITIRDFAERIKRDFPNRPAFHFLGLTWTNQELLEHADRFARALHAHGIRKGDVLAINLVNSPQFLIAYIGAMKAGVIFSSLAPLLTADEMVHQLSDLRAKAIITSDNLYEEKLAGIAGRLPSLELVIVTKLSDFLEESDSVSALTELPGKKVRWLKELLSQPSGPLPEVRLEPEDVLCIQYTGGTTGMAKGAVLTHRNYVAHALQYGMWLHHEMGTEVAICCFPMFHAGGLSHAIRSLAFAMVQVIIPNPRDTQHIIKEAALHRPTYLSCVPTLYLRLMQEPEFRGLDFSGLRICACGAAPFPSEKSRDFDELFGPGKMINSLGVTETTNTLICNPVNGVKKQGSVGIPLPSTRVKLVDTETGEREIPTGEEGEIIARGPQIMKGYFNKPEETANALREHNGELWLHTGDVARMDEDGFFFIVDRTKDMISVGGFKVFSTEVEHKLSKSPAVELCAIIGVPNPGRPGDSIVKLVVQKSPAYRDVPDEALREQLIAFCREQMAPYKVPKIIEFTKSMPLTSVGKVDKKSLRPAGQSK